MVLILKILADIHTEDMAINMADTIMDIKATADMVMVDIAVIEAMDTVVMPGRMRKNTNTKLKNNRFL